VLDRAALALEEWLDASGITEGAIFRRLWKHRVGPALSPAAVGEIVQRYADRLAHHARTAPYNWFNFYDFWHVQSDNRAPLAAVVADGNTDAGEQR
jgi:hypothetical protein